MVSGGGETEFISVDQSKAYRLINSKLPPIALFDDIANAEDFPLLYRLQEMTNPRLRAEAGDLSLLPTAEIPFGIPGCSYAVAPFTHVNPMGSRFSDGLMGVLYLADSEETAIKEVAYHQDRYWRGVEGLHFERFIFRSLICSFASAGVSDATQLPMSDPIYNPDDYSASRAMAAKLRTSGAKGIQYHSVRNPGAECWALFTPKGVRKVSQSGIYEFIWNGRITAINAVSSVT